MFLPSWEAVMVTEEGADQRLRVKQSQRLWGVGEKGTMAQLPPRGSQRALTASSPGPWVSAAWTLLQHRRSPAQGHWVCLAEPVPTCQACPGEPGTDHTAPVHFSSRADDWTSDHGGSGPGCNDWAG